MSSQNIDLNFLQEGIAQLQEYLLSNELYWPLSGSLPRLTPGSVLLVLKRLEASTQVEKVATLDQQVQIIRTKWRTAWEKKAAREVTNRMRLWSQFLSDFIHEPDKSQETYKTEVRSRVILQLLLTDQPDLPEKSNIAELDNLLHSRLQAGAFVWEPELQGAFPKNEFWFLYGTL